jgi:RNA polymerase sigma-70 factor (ECF subfamily)
VTSAWPAHAEGPFRDLYRAHFDAVLAYAVRRTEQAADAADVVAETFLVAWRRAPEIPGGPGARLWLFGVARRVLANHHRGGRRRHQLGLRLRDRLTAADARDHAEDVASRGVVTTAMRRLGELDREVLALSAWEELEPREIAEVLGISADAARTRLTRARRRMRELLGHDEAVTGHVLGAGRTAVPARLNPEEYR